MKLNIKAFTLSCLTVCTIPALILFSWCAINNFGIEVVTLFEKIHPSGAFSLTTSVNLTLVSKIPGIIFNTLYVAADSFIFSFIFSMLYNLIATKSEKGK